MPKEFFFYVVTDQPYGLLHTGVTDNLAQCAQKHLLDCRATENKMCRLVYYETYKTRLKATQREKVIRKWDREKKLNLLRRSIQNGMTSMMICRSKQFPTAVRILS